MATNFSFTVTTFYKTTVLIKDDDINYCYKMTAPIMSHFIKLK